MNDNIDQIVENAKIEVRGAKNRQMLKSVETKYIGNNGLLPRSLKSAEQLPPAMQEGRKKSINDGIRKVNKAIEKKEKELKLPNG